jgi:spore coat protein U-like protein
MSKRLITLTMVVLALGFVGSAMADNEAGDFQVTATVLASCKVDSVSELAFGTYANSEVKTAATIKVTCVARDDDATLALSDGANWLAKSGGSQDRRMKYSGDSDHFLSYKLFETSDAGACWGGTNVCAEEHLADVTQNSTQQTFTVYGVIAPNQGLYVGSYSDTVTATVNF